MLEINHVEQSYKACKKLPCLVPKMVKVEANFKGGSKLQVCQISILVCFVPLQLDAKLVGGYFFYVPFFNLQKYMFLGFSSLLYIFQQYNS
jgi:hypothetical protein